jgi:hypothetical protein
MFDDISADPRSAPRAPFRSSAPVTDLASRRRGDDLLHSITFVFGGIHYGTFSIDAPYPKGKPIVLYLVPVRERDADFGDGPCGPLDCLITDDAALGLERAAR